MDHEAVECLINVTTCNWFATASITVSARGLEKGFKINPFFVQHFTLHRTPFHVMTLFFMSFYFISVNNFVSLGYFVSCQVYLDQDVATPSPGCDAMQGGRVSAAASSDCAISSEFRQRMHDAINEAHAISARPMQILMPWEEQSFAWVFGEKDPLEFPTIAPVWGYIEPQPEEVETRTGGAIAISDKPTVFEGAIAFNSFRTCHLCEGDQFALLAQKWEALISVNYSAFDLGIHLFDKEYPERVRVVAEVLGGKSPATLSRRLSQLTRFAKWAREEANRMPFPISSELVKNYIRHLRNLESGHTAYKGFAEVLKFAKHVVGLDCDLSALQSAWVSGIIRAAQQQRPLRKQSTTLNVKTLQFLEAYLCNPAFALVDRYAAGVFLFAVYSRARFGDLKRVARIIIDEVRDASEGSLGFVEMMSESHKMRATGNRLGAHLPLIAPIKGLSEVAWGREFIKVSRLAGLDISDWQHSRPLLPAPTQIGDWTDRAVTTVEVGKWLHGILAKCSDFDPQGFTPHGCKATTLIMLSKYGASSDDRLVLGHHQLHKGALEVYSRDLQSAPLRVLEQMFSDIRCGRFSPDVTRSGMFTPVPNLSISAAARAGDVSPVPTTPIDDTRGSVGVASPMTPPLTTEESIFDSSPVHADAVTMVADGDLLFGAPSMDADAAMMDDSDDTDSEFCSEESDAEEAIREMATSQRPAGQWHPGCSLHQHKRSKLVHALSMFGQRAAFLCGRPLSAEYKPFQAKFFVDAMKCQQCNKGQTPTPEGKRAAAVGAAVKRARKS